MLLCSLDKISCLSDNLWLTDSDTLTSLGPVFTHNIEVIDFMKLKLLNGTA